MSPWAKTSAPTFAAPPVTEGQAMPEPHLGHMYPSVYIPQLDDILAAFETQKGQIMALSDSIQAFKDAILAKVADEFGQIAEKVDALQAQVEANTAAQTALDELRAEVSDAEVRLSEAADEVGAQVDNLSTAGDDTPPEPPA